MHMCLGVSTEARKSKGLVPEENWFSLLQQGPSSESGFLTNAGWDSKVARQGSQGLADVTRHFVVILGKSSV